jgi:hypothetical protein
MKVPVLGSVTLNKIFSASQLPADSIGSSFYGMYVVDDESIVCLYRTSVSGNYGISAIVINASGNFTYYSTGTISNYIFPIPFYGPIKNSIFGIIKLAGGFDASFSFSPQNLGLNNRVPIPIGVNTRINISTPCFGPPQFFAYDRVNNLLGLGAYDPVGQDGGPCFSATFSLDDPNNPRLLTSGFVGYYYSGYPYVDPYNLTQNGINFTINSSTNVLQSNGISTVIGYDHAGNFRIVRNDYECNLGITTDCPQGPIANPNGSFVNSRVNATISFFQNNGYNQYNNLFDSNVKGLVGGANFNGSNSGNPAIQLFDANNVVAEIDYFPGFYPGYAAITNKNVFVVEIYWPGNLWMVSWPGKFPQFLGNGPQTRQQINLVNLSRPVSPIGAFRT